MHVRDRNSHALMFVAVVGQMMNVDKLHLGRHQPFYTVLVDERDRPGGQSTYVAQVSIPPSPPTV